MINSKKVLAIIPARGGSKGIQMKNIKQLGDKPLIAWTIEEAKKSNYIDNLIVSSDNKTILDIARERGAETPFLRPSELAQDDTPGIDPVLHAIEYFPGYQYVVLLQPTSPFRSVKDIDGAIERCVNGNRDSCVSVSATDQPPYWMYTIDDNNGLSSLFPQSEIPFQRQQAPKTYILNGAVYVAKVDALLEYGSFLMDDVAGYILPEKRSIDIDTIDDFSYCEYLIDRNLL